MSVSESDDFDAHEIRVAIHDGFTLDDPKRPRNYRRSNICAASMRCANCCRYSGGAENTVEIAKRCNVTVRLGEYFLPQFLTGDMTTEDYLVKNRKRGSKNVWLSFASDRRRAQKASPGI